MVAFTHRGSPLAHVARTRVQPPPRCLQPPATAATASNRSRPPAPASSHHQLLRPAAAGVDLGLGQEETGEEMWIGEKMG
jgi:hypothetical protein